jgi:hypothetical protein
MERLTKAPGKVQTLIRLDGQWRGTTCYLTPPYAHTSATSQRDAVLVTLASCPTWTRLMYLDCVVIMGALESFPRPPVSWLRKVLRKRKDQSLTSLLPAGAILKTSVVLCCVQGHPFFAGIDWDRLYSQQSPYVPRVEHELDTQNFEQFEEEGGSGSSSSARRWARADPTFVGYTYKNWEAVGSNSGKSSTLSHLRE